MIPHPCALYTQWLSVLLVTENISCCVHQHCAEENPQHQHESSQSFLDSAVQLAQVRRGSSHVLEGQEGSNSLKRDYSILLEQAAFRRVLL